LTPPSEETRGRPLAEAWWVIAGDELLAALWRAHMGDDPGVVYAELLVNAERSRP
jgi:hypothetical protein